MINQRVVAVGWVTMEMLDDKGVIGGSDRRCRVVAVVGCPRVREL